MLNGIFPDAEVSVTVCWPSAVIWLSWPPMSASMAVSQLLA